MFSFLCALCLQLEAASRLAGQLRALEARVVQLEAQLHQADRSRADQLKRSETKLGKRMTSVERGLHQELQLLKQEYHKGGRSPSVTCCHQWVNTHMLHLP